MACLWAKMSIQPPKQPSNSDLLTSFNTPPLPMRRPHCFAGDTKDLASKPSPIHIAPKPKSRSRKKAQNVFYDNRGFPDESDNFDSLLHNINGGAILRRTKFPTPPLDADDPTFTYIYSDELHGDKLRSELDVSHLCPTDASALLNLIKEYWSVFDEHGTFTPV
jgi:hypothetical protein